MFYSHLALPFVRFEPNGFGKSSPSLYISFNVYNVKQDQAEDVHALLASPILAKDFHYDARLTEHKMISDVCTRIVTLYKSIHPTSVPKVLPYMYSHEEPLHRSAAVGVFGVNTSLSFSCISRSRFITPERNSQINGELNSIIIPDDYHKFEGFYDTNEMARLKHFIRAERAALDFSAGWGHV